MDTRTPTGKLMLTVLGNIARFEREMWFEREMMLERQLESIANAQAAGKYRGRKPDSDGTAGRSSSLGGHRHN